MEILSLVRSHRAKGVKVVTVRHCIPEGESALSGLHGNSLEKLFNGGVAGISGEEGHGYLRIVEGSHDCGDIVIGIRPVLPGIVDSLGITVKGAYNILIAVKGPDRVVKVKDEDLRILSCGESLLRRHGGQIHLLCEGGENYVVRGFNLC